MTTVPIEALMAKASENNFHYRKAQMEGKRIVVSDEIPEERRPRHEILAEFPVELSGTPTTSTA